MVFLMPKEVSLKKADNRFYIQLVQKDHAKIAKLKQELAKMNIATGIIHNPSKQVDPNYWRIFVSTHSHRIFADTIGSWHPKKQIILKERMKI